MDLQIGHYNDDLISMPVKNQIAADLDAKKYIYLSYGFKPKNIGTSQASGGGCFTFLPIEINREELKYAREWKYEKQGDTYEMALLN